MLKYVSVWIFSFTTLISLIDTYQRVVWEYTVGLNILGHIIAYTGVGCIIFFHVKWYNDVTPKNPYTIDLDLMIKLEEENLLQRQKETSDKKLAKMEAKSQSQIAKLSNRQSDGSESPQPVSGRNRYSLDVVNGEKSSREENQDPA